MRVLMVAPFPRGRGHGGSQRATAVAERLEDRGHETGWQVIPARVTSGVEKLRSIGRGEPALTGMYDAPSELLPGRWDAVLVAHSYLVGAVLACAGSTPVVADFHNLEWLHLADSARLERHSGRRGVARRAYVATQVSLMRRCERRVVRRAALNLFVSPSDLEWARAGDRDARVALVPSVLPRRAERSAEEIAARRRPDPIRLAYVGTLTFPTNLLSLQRFLSDCWPSIRRANPAVLLTVAGACSEAERRALERHPGVQALGFVDDLSTVVAPCSAMLMPFDGVAGTSLRGLYYALAGVPVIGPRRAFRGLPFGIASDAETPAEWADAVSEVTGDPARVQTAVALAREAVRLHQCDEAPWDRLADAVVSVTAGGGRPRPRLAGVAT